MEIFINDAYLGTSKAPFDFYFTPSGLDNLKDLNDLKIIAYDSVYNNAETSSVFRVQ